VNFPLSFWDVDLLMAVIGIILLVASEMLSPYYGRTNIIINRKRLRNTALTVSVLFLIIAITARVVDVIFT
jgi:hypothetical protein